MCHGPYVPTSLPTLPFRSIVLGVAIAMFFRCMIALLDPVGRMGKDIKWGSVAHTVAMFLVLTTSTVLGLEMKSVAYVDNRDFHGGDEALLGPLGYYDRILSFRAISAAFSIALPLNQWLADGLLVRTSNTVSNPIIPCSMHIVLSAVSLLHHLFDELLGHGTPVIVVPCLHWYALISISRRPFSLTSPIQRRESHLRGWHRNRRSPMPSQETSAFRITRFPFRSTPSSR